jgi:stage V sporulation protein R
MKTKQKTKKILSTTAEWTLELLRTYDKHIAAIAKAYGLDTYPNQVEIISAEQMMDAYASIGMPLNYHHWSFGKKFLQIEKNYRRGHMGLAYEIVINSNPCIAYLMEENSMAMQALVLAHACYGHNSFFKSNYLFKAWTNPDAIVDYLLFAKNYISECEEKYGVAEVEQILDACHALMNYGVDRYRHPAKLSLLKERERQKTREDYLRTQVNELWRTLPANKKIDANKEQRFPAEPQENILYFIEKNAPLLEVWQREIVRIVRKVAQYFYPQRQTQVMNEGWACFWHYTILNKLYEEHLVTDEFMLEIIQTHTNVIYQPAFDDPRYSGINPYALGYNIYTDIRRICENPTEEDRQWFPDLVNTDWIKAVDFAMRNFKDESFIAQYLSPKLIRDLKLFAVVDDDQNPDLVISAIHDEQGYRQVRQALSEQYNLSNIEPNIQVYNVNRRGDRSLTLRHVQHQQRPTSTDTDAILKYLHKLWGFTVYLETADMEGNVHNVVQFPV